MKPQWEGRKRWALRSEGEVAGCEAGEGLPAEERWELTICEEVAAVLRRDSGRQGQEWEAARGVGGGVGSGGRRGEWGAARGVGGGAGSGRWHGECSTISVGGGGCGLRWEGAEGLPVDMRGFSNGSEARDLSTYLVPFVKQTGPLLKVKGGSINRNSFGTADVNKDFHRQRGAYSVWWEDLGRSPLRPTDSCSEQEAWAQLHKQHPKHREHETGQGPSVACRGHQWVE